MWFLFQISYFSYWDIQLCKSQKNTECEYYDLYVAGSSLIKVLLDSLVLRWDILNLYYSNGPS